MALVPLFGFASAPALAQGSVPLVRSNMVMIVQGENDVTSGAEGKNDFYALKIMSFELPHDSSRVYTSLPPGASEVNVWTLSSPLNQSLYGTEISGDNSGDFFVDVPASHGRTSTFTNTTANESAFNAPGRVLDNTAYSSGALQLTSGSESGTYTSADLPVSSAFDIVSGNLSLSGTYLENVTIYLSNDGGTIWTPCENATEFDFASSGTTVKVRLVFEGNSTLGMLPTVSSFTVIADFVQLKTIFSVHISCLWTQNFTDRAASIDLSEAMQYTSPGSFLVMLYTLKGYKPEGVGFSLTKDETSSMNTYPDKDLYLYSASSLPTGGNISIRLTAPEPDYSWVFYVAGGAGILALFGLIVLRRPRRVASSKSEKENEEVGEDQPDGDWDGRRKELVERKKRIMAEMAGLREKGPSDELGRLKGELKQVRNALNKLPKTGEVPAAPEEKPALGEPPNPQYEAALASIARLDDDFERGRLPEGTYRSLRQEYVSKAAALMASRGEEAGEAQNPLVAEKTKLMEAILALDDEHEKGEVDEKVYRELRGSYRRELTDLARRLDEHGKGK